MELFRVFVHKGNRVIAMVDYIQAEAKREASAEAQRVVRREKNLPVNISLYCAVLLSEFTRPSGPKLGDKFIAPEQTYVNMEDDDGT